MFRRVRKLLSKLKQQYADGREYLFELDIEYIDTDRLVLSGQVLLEEQLRQVCQDVQALARNLVCDFSGVEVLCRPENRVLTVTTNLAGLQSSPSFFSEQLSQLLSGRRLEVLKEKDDWVFGRCDDGYLGWLYRPYLADLPLEPASHLVVAPVVILSSQPQEQAEPRSRLLAGTFLSVESMRAGWAWVSAPLQGWLPLASLRSLAEMPRAEAKCRAQMVADAVNLVGVPYQWGGSSPLGIDCSGFVQLVHRLSGIDLRRDADMQMADCTPVTSEDLRPGDLVFFRGPEEIRNASHVALSLGGSKIIHASQVRNGVYIDDLEQTPALRERVVAFGSAVRRA